MCRGSFGTEGLPCKNCKSSRHLMLPTEIWCTLLGERSCDSASSARYFPKNVQSKKIQPIMGVTANSGRRHCIDPCWSTQFLPKKPSRHAYSWGTHIAYGDWRRGVLSGTCDIRECLHAWMQAAMSLMRLGGRFQWHMLSWTAHWTICKYEGLSHEIIII